MTKIKSIGVFMGAVNGNNPEFIEAARQAGQLIGRHNLRLIYGGGRFGLMGEVATSAFKHGAEVIGVTPNNLAEEAIGKDQISELIVVDDMSQRKEIMIDKSDAFLVMPGGFGTLEELGQILDWNKINLIDKPIYLYNQDHFYDSLVEWISQAQKDDFIPEQTGYLTICDNLSDIFTKIIK